ncbi:helix-turn-helix domain-containing protein [Zavarzinia sp.]|uniref:helix-turn-helix domain-containing protein n=1 Tax=Zavarzinia sp. TaxID=2027920 RepID=UPI003BB70A6C
MIGDKTFAESLRMWRSQMGWSQSRAASELACSVRTLQGWEAGRPCAHEASIRKLMSLL